VISRPATIDADTRTCRLCGRERERRELVIQPSDMGGWEFLCIDEQDCRAHEGWALLSACDGPGIHVVLLPPWWKRLLTTALLAAAAITVGVLGIVLARGS
jgi:hypothetical protein